jgi:hypothetical protein
MYKAAQTTHNRSLNASPPSAARATQNASRGLRPFVAFCSATFFCARKNASHFSLSGAKKRRLPPERYTTFALTFVSRLNKNERGKTKLFLPHRHSSLRAILGAGVSFKIWGKHK